MVLRVEDGKRHQDRYVMLSPALLAVLRDWWRVHRPPHWLFPGENPEQPITSHAVREACQRAHRRCRIPKPVTPHSLRHSCATLLLAQGVNPRVVMETLGHSQGSLTLNTYSHVLPARQEDAAAKMDAILSNRGR